MTKKKIRIITSLLAVGCLGVALWAGIRYQARRELMEQFNSDLAVRFDSILAITYPLIDGYATAMKDNADSIQVMANRAKADDHQEYSDAFVSEWAQYTKTPEAGKGFALMGEYEYLRNSPVYTMLMNSGDKRKKEMEALQKLTMARDLLRDPFFKDYETVMNATKTARQQIDEGLEVMEPYRSKNTNVRAWRNVTPQQYFKMFEKYNKTRN